MNYVLSKVQWRNAIFNFPHFALIFHSFHLKSCNFYFDWRFTLAVVIKSNNLLKVESICVLKGTIRKAERLNVHLIYCNSCCENWFDFINVKWVFRLCESFFSANRSRYMIICMRNMVYIWQIIQKILEKHANHSFWRFNMNHMEFQLIDRQATWLL